jgi:hypothetical protein
MTETINQKRRTYLPAAGHDWLLPLDDPLQRLLGSRYALSAQRPSELLSLSDWLASCTHVAMEATGVYWKPIYNILEGQMELLVVNAQHIKAVPGRKTDVKDAEWIAELLQHGLLRGSFIPPQSQRDLRDLTRYRTTLVRERARIVNRLQKVLEDANLKLAGVATDVMGVSGRPCWRRCWLARSTASNWPSWPRGGCGRIFPS